MGSVVRGAVVYLTLLLVFRLAGKRTLKETTTFDLVLLLIISESIQQAMLDNDSSLTNAFLLVITLVTLDITLSLVKEYSPRARRILEGVPVLIIEDGTMHQDRMRKERVDRDDVMAAAREKQAVSRMDEIRHAVLEENGDITVIPRERR
jgi:uncharacterized membrane protein YcaP (DUF421 family)